MAHQGRRRDRRRPAAGLGRDRQGDRGHPLPYDARVAKRYTARPASWCVMGARSPGFEGGAETADTGTVVGGCRSARRCAPKRQPRSRPPPMAARRSAHPAVHARCSAQGGTQDGHALRRRRRDHARDVQRAAQMLAEAGPSEPLRAIRRTMAQNMSLARASRQRHGDRRRGDHAWAPGTDVTVRLIRALVAGAAPPPASTPGTKPRDGAPAGATGAYVGIAVDRRQPLRAGAARRRQP